MGADVIARAGRAEARHADDSAVVADVTFQPSGWCEGTRAFELMFWFF
jgi:hypothetical protein